MNMQTGSRYFEVGCDIQFLNIENIHTMRDCLKSVFDLLKVDSESGWLTGLDNTGWLRHIRHILQGASMVASVSTKKKKKVSTKELKKKKR